MNHRKCLCAALVAVVFTMTGLGLGRSHAKLEADDIYRDQAQVIEVNPDGKYVRVGGIQDPTGKGSSILVDMKRARLTDVDPKDPYYHFKDAAEMRAVLDRSNIQPLQTVELLYRVIGNRKVIVDVKPANRNP